MRATSSARSADGSQGPGPHRDGLQAVVPTQEGMTRGDGPIRGRLALLVKTPDLLAKGGNTRLLRRLQGPFLGSASRRAAYAGGMHRTPFACWTSHRFYDLDRASPRRDAWYSAGVQATRRARARPEASGLQRHRVPPANGSSGRANRADSCRAGPSRPSRCRRERRATRILETGLRARRRALAARRDGRHHALRGSLRIPRLRVRS